jgi:hypothetical protein
VVNEEVQLKKVLHGLGSYRKTRKHGAGRVAQMVRVPAYQVQGPEFKP